MPKNKLGPQERDSVPAPLGERPSGWTRIEINDVPPSQNITDRMHFRATGRLRDRWVWAIRAALSDIGYTPRGKSAPKMSINVAIWHKRKYDPKNAEGGMKHIWDAMTIAGLIRDDSEDWLDGGVSQMIGPERTVIEFRETGK